MTIIPASLLDKFNAVARDMITAFGVTCTLVYTEKVEVDSNGTDLKERRTLNPKHSGSFKYGGVTYETIETTEDIIMQVKWVSKPKYDHLTKSVVYPEEKLVTLCSIDHLEKIMRSKFIKVQSDNFAHKEWKFVRDSDPVLQGVDNKFIACEWVKA